MEKDILEIMEKFYIDYLNNLSKFEKVWVFTKLGIKVDHYGRVGESV